MPLTNTLLMFGMLLIAVDILLGRRGRTTVDIRRGKINTFSIGLAVIALAIITHAAGLS